MIESNNPEINVDELMHKICEEVVKRRVPCEQIDLQSNLDTSKLKLSISYIENFLKNAESRSGVRTKWPDKLNIFPFNFSTKLQKLILKIINFLFKDEREVNFNIISSLKESVALNYQLIEQITTLKAQVDTRIQGLDECLVNVDTRIQGLDKRLVNVDTHIQALDERLVNVDTSIQGIEDSLNAIDTLINNWLTGLQEGLDTMNMQVQYLDEHLSTVDARVGKLNEHLITTDNRIITADTRIQEINERYIRNDSYLKNDLIQQKHLITVFLEEARKCLPENFSQEQLQTLVNENTHFFDAFYVAFEDQFRGSRQDILNRLKVYLPLIAGAKIGKPESPILDVGCGRGEWLELLQEAGYTARGLDINRLMIQQCKARGLEVIEKDALSYLQSLPDSSLGAVTGFHIIEHLPFEDLLKLFGEAARVIKTGGLVIFETPNPQNVLVGSCSFYYDPTHRNPLPFLTIEYIAQYYGFSHVQILKLNPSEQNRVADNSELTQRFNEYFYGSMDYAVIGFKS
ncbi:methyltransferase domain-containing protein [Nostoc sp. FACHB-888]|nr:class I SAM-dependent methyltransferase [Nostoc sp. FACHB-888]MBD2246369.1 methyltransferase domain-containing protein [Nostoc sp. FACHB-888]